MHWLQFVVAELNSIYQLEISMNERVFNNSRQGCKGHAFSSDALFLHLKAKDRVNGCNLLQVYVFALTIWTSM